MKSKSMPENCFIGVVHSDDARLLAGESFASEQFRAQLPLNRQIPRALISSGSVSDCAHDRDATDFETGPHGFVHTTRRSPSTVAWQRIVVKTIIINVHH